MFVSVLSGYCVYFCNGFKCFLGVFASVSDACFKCFIYLQTYVTSVASECFKSRLGVASPSSPSAASPQCLLLFSAPTGHPLPPPYLIDANDVQGDAGPMWAHKTAWEKECRCGRPGASKPDCQSEPTRNLLELKIHTFIRPNLYVIFCFSGYITFIIYLDILYI